MTAAIETCPCGAKIEISNAGMAELRERLKEWRGEHKHSEPVNAEQAQDPHPEGNNITQTERTADIRPHHINADERPQSPYGRSIGLRWQPEAATK